MTTKKFMVTGILYLLISSQAMSEEPLWQIKPIEIIEGKVEPQKALVTAENQELSTWRVVSDLNVTLTPSSERQLWRKTVMKVSFTKPGACEQNKLPERNQMPEVVAAKAQEGQTITLLPPKPIAISGRFNSVDLWVHCAKKCTPVITVNVVDAKGVLTPIKLSGGDSRWCNMGWWTMAHGNLLKSISGMKFYSIDINDVTSTNDCLYFDALSFYQDLRKSLDQPTTKLFNTVPTTPDTILPTCNEKDFSNTVSHKEGQYLFTYRGKDCAIEYRYLPQTGSLSDIEAQYNNKISIIPAAGGGLFAKVKGISFSPDDTEIKARLISQTLEAEKLTTRWAWTKSGERVWSSKYPATNRS
jgi:hypothetical protein